MIVGAALRGACLRMPPFGIWHFLKPFLSHAVLTTARLSFQLLANIFQCCPAWIAQGLHAIAALHVEVAAAMGAKSFALPAANLLYRQCQQYLLFQHVFQQQTFTLIVTDFRVVEADGCFV